MKMQANRAVHEIRGILLVEHNSTKLKTVVWKQQSVKVLNDCSYCKLKTAAIFKPIVHSGFVAFVSTNKTL